MLMTNRSTAIDTNNMKMSPLKSIGESDKQKMEKVGKGRLLTLLGDSRGQAIIEADEQKTTMLTTTTESGVKWAHRRTYTSRLVSERRAF